MPRFSAGKPSAAFQMVRSCESDSANMRPWSSEGSGCQLLSCDPCAPAPPQTVMKIVTTL
jgi:hypothetical protein